LAYFPSFSYLSTDTTGRQRMWLQPLTFQEQGDVIWTRICDDEENNTTPPLPPYIAPEHFNPSFRCVEGFVDIDQYQDIINENLLDMLHISYVHSFGNRLAPFPIEVMYESLGPTSGRSSFLYAPPVNTISQRVGGESIVHVENEFYLPSTTITRVVAKNVTKTVWTSSVPLQGKRSRLFWRVYRNFWMDPFLPWFSKIGDFLIRKLMELTLREDQDILSHVMEERRLGPLKTKYDITILKYRHAKARFLDR